MADLEDNSMVGHTFAHPKADAGTTPARSVRPSVSGRMFLAVTCGALFGVVLSVIVHPGYALAFAIGGAMSFGAGAVMLMLFTPDDTGPPESAHTEEEVRAALAEIKARDK